jgi:hypothetical protein
MYEEKKTIFLLNCSSAEHIRRRFSSQTRLSIEWQWSLYSPLWNKTRRRSVFVNTIVIVANSRHRWMNVSRNSIFLFSSCLTSSAKTERWERQHIAEYSSLIVVRQEMERKRTEENRGCEHWVRKNERISLRSSPSQSELRIWHSPPSVQFA